MQHVRKLWYTSSVGERLQELPQLSRRELAEALLHLALLPLHEDPAGDAVPVDAHEVDPSAHRPQRAIRLRFHEHVPVLGASPPLTHLPRARLARKHEI